MSKFILSMLLFALISVGSARAAVDYSKPIELKFTAIDGREVDLAKLRGKVVLIDFWATWCPPCRAIAPDIVALYRKYHSRGLEVIGVSVDSDKKMLPEFVKSEGLVWPQYCDYKGADSELAARFGVELFPTILLLNKEGMVVNKNMVDLWDAGGGIERTTSEATRARVEAAIEAQLKAP